MTRGILARHDRDAGRRANAHSVEVVESDTAISETFHVGSPIPIIERVTLGFTVFVREEGDRGVHYSHVVDEEDDNVGLFRLCGGCGEKVNCS